MSSYYTVNMCNSCYTVILILLLFTIIRLSVVLDLNIETIMNSFQTTGTGS